MDIPQQPKSISITPPSPAKLAQVESATIKPVAIEALNLEKNKVYHAIVSKLIASTPLPQTPQTNTSTEWLLKLNGKLLLITSQKPLQTGQSLSVKLDTGGSLLVLPSAPLSTTQTVNTSQTSPNSTVISSLLSAINQVMPRQVSLDTGLMALEILSKQDTSSPVSKQAQTVLAMLAKQAPKQQFFTATNIQESSASPSKAIANALNNSGVFFESALSHALNKQSTTKQSPDTHVSSQQTTSSQTSLKHQFLLVQQILSNGQASKQATINSSTSNTQQTSLSELNAIRTALQHASSKFKTGSNKATSPTNTTTSATTPSSTQISPSLTTVPSTAFTTAATTPTTPTTSTTSTTASISALTTAPTTTPGQSISSTNDQQNSNTDLKALLLVITAALKTKPTSISQPPRNHVDALAQLDLLSSPFNFPHLSISPTNQTTKAEALLAEQQFTTGQLLKLVAGMLNRIQFNQLNSLYQTQNNSSETTNIQTWFFELPVANTHNQFSSFEVRIDRESEREDDTQEEQEEDTNKKFQWNLALSFNFEQLGAIYVQVQLSPPSISSTIWADHPDTLALINREKPHFQSKLSELGLEVLGIRCKKGQPKQNKTRLGRSLVDIKA